MSERHLFTEGCARVPPSNNQRSNQSCVLDLVALFTFQKLAAQAL